MSEQNTMEKDYFIFSIKVLMEEKGINQKKLAEMTDSEEALISRWLNGKTSPSYEKMKEIAEALDCYVELIPKEKDVFETAYFAGYEYGRQLMLKDCIKMLKEMKWYGGDKSKKRAN